MFITSAATTTPFHFDSKIAFFSQIEGEKTYHVYPPEGRTEVELEDFYVRNIVNIGQVDLDRRNPASELIFKLRPGLGLHQPQNLAPSGDGSAFNLPSRSQRSSSL